jgi:mRNA interferase RelE/StbE
MMAPYEIVFQPSVEKDLRKLSVENCDRIMVRLEALASEPFPPQVAKLKGTERLYRIRVGDYRIIYEVEPEANCILIHYVRHRRDAYRDLQ